MSAGIELDCDLFRPNSGEKFPALLGCHAYSKDDQFAPLTPVGTGGLRGHMEAGDSQFFVRRGYAHVICNMRGTGESGGFWQCWGPDEIKDIADVIGWIADQPWCDGNVGMFGPSYFAIVQKRVAALEPPALKCLFAMYGLTDLYRDFDYNGGILRYTFRQRWIDKISNLKVDNALRRELGDEEYESRIAAALSDPEIAAVPHLVQALNNPDHGRNPYIVAPVIQPLDGPWYRRHSLDDDARLGVPAYLGSCWGVYGLHGPGDFRSWDRWSGPKKFTVGPPIYLDRPVYQYHFEALRWFDHWLKDNDTGIMAEPPVQIFLDEAATWVEADDWPLPETRFTPFYLHENGLLSEPEHWPNEPHSVFVDSPYQRGELTFRTPPMVEQTDICGPFSLTLYAATTDTYVLWFASLIAIAPDGEERLLTRGWLRGSQRRMDPARSTPWVPWHSHDRREPLTPGEIYEFCIAIVPYGIRLRPGWRLGIRLRGCDDETPAHHLQGIAQGHVARQSSARISVYHDSDHPSHLLVPVIRGNRIGTFISGGKITT